MILFVSTMSFSQKLDTLKYTILSQGIKQTGDFGFYEAKNGYVYKVGERIKIGFPSTNKSFAFINEMNPMAILGGNTPLEIIVGSEASNTETEILGIEISGTKRKGYTCRLRTKASIGLYVRYIYIENALETNEIKSNVMSSDDALTELKKNKEKLELGIITQEQFDIKKQELLKYIK